MPFPFSQSFPTPAERWAGVNSKKYIIVHHTGTKEGTTKGVLDGLNKREDFASCHFLVNEAGESFKMGSPSDILYHAGVSQWGKTVDMNRHSMGIEIIGPLSNGGFTEAEKKTVRDLIQHLMAVFSIPAENVLRHADITWGGSAKCELWDGFSKSRKVDVASSFFQPAYIDWRAYQKSLVPREIK